MGRIRILFSTFGLTLLVVGCQNTSCRELQDHKDNKTVNQSGSVSAAPTAASSNPSAGANLLKVRVYKPDGSLQCGMGKKVSLESMEKELEGIQIFSRSNRNDGLMRIQVCGAPTGNANVYEINRDDLSKALKKGFKEWTFE